MIFHDVSFPTRAGWKLGIYTDKKELPMKNNGLAANKKYIYLEIYVANSSGAVSVAPHILNTS